MTVKNKKGDDNQPVTRRELKIELTELRTEFRSELRAELCKFEDKIMGKLDEIVGILQKHDQENTIRDYDIERHEVMLKKVNHRLKIPHPRR